MLFKKFFELKKLNEKTIIISIGILSAIFTSMFLHEFNSDFAGAKYDSQFYLNMFDLIEANKSIVNVTSYEVASSPIFVHAIGWFLLLFGSLSNVVLSVIYLAMALGSLIFFEKLISKAQLNIKILLTIIFCGSGYFVSPMWNPTSDTPMILMLIISIYSFNNSKRKLFAFSLFLLVSTRQNFGWLLLVYFILDLYALLK